MQGTNLEVPFSRVVDGDTIRVFLPDQQKDESLRILALDTEESNSGSNKPITPWGHEAKRRANEFFAGAQTVTIEFPGAEPVVEAIKKHRGNFGRLLVFVYREGVDFQETMIREGFSPYFVKYGNARFTTNHERYTRAERHAQRQRIGVWDQIAVNGSVMRDYAALGTWWQLRAEVIDDYRARKQTDPSLLNTRLDHAKIAAKAQAQEAATVFTEVSSIRRVGANSGLIFTGSHEQPFDLFLPDMDSAAGQEVMKLLETRYISGGESQPRRSYAYVTGELSMFGGKPQMVLDSADQITDVPGAREESEAGARIAALVPDPTGPDLGHEKVTLRNTGAGQIALDGWRLEDRGGGKVSLDGESLAPLAEVVIALAPNQLPLNNTGDEVRLIDATGVVRHKVRYEAQDVVTGQPILFG